MINALVSDRTSRVFPGAKFDKDMIMGREFSQTLLPLQRSAYFERVDDLIKQLNLGQPVQAEIDRYLLCMHVESTCGVSSIPRELLVVCPEHVFTLAHLPDIGSYISKLIICHNHSSVDLMSRLIHYSMPYIKHNRMNFPVYSPDQAHVLPDIVNIMLACCLAMYPDSSKKPVLQLRVKLMMTIHSLKARGSPMDLYTFCTSNMSLLRIAMIEYFVYFISSFMPNETSMLTTVFGLQQDIADIFRQFTIICDTFRHQSMQDHVLDLSDINLKAQVAIDKCNRVCKGKSRTSRRSERRVDNSVYTIDIVRRAMRDPMLAHVTYAMHGCPSAAMASIHHVHQLQCWIRQHELPCNLRSVQMRRVARALHEDTLNTLNTIYMHICLVCVVNCRVSLDIKMRVMANGTTGCTTCHNIGTVVRICTLGRIVRVRDSAFYFCSCCMRVHAWTASGCEFQPCERAQRPRGAVAPPGRSCYFCARTNNIEAVSVLDDEHGVMQELSLCGRHMPFEQRMKYVENLDQLRQAVRDKLNRVHV